MSALGFVRKKFILWHPDCCSLLRCLYHPHLDCCSTGTSGWLVWKVCSSAKDVSWRLFNAPDMIQHADLSITRLGACPWPNMGPMHWDSSNSRSLRICSSKTNVSHSTSKNCIKPEETMLFLQVCFKSTQVFFWSQSYNSVKLDTILESHRKH